MEAVNLDCNFSSFSLINDHEFIIAAFRGIIFKMWQKIKNVYHLAMAIWANVFFGFPGRKLTIIGVTGTDGKTTTVNLIYHILKEAGFSASMISTTGAIIKGKKYPLGFHVTTPSSFDLQKYIAKSQDKNKDKSFLILEVTSHSIDQNRIFGIPFNVTVLTNITNEHLDYHKTFENYLKTKIKLLERSKIRIVNKDDDSYATIKKMLDQHAGTTYTYSLNEDADFVFDKENIATDLIGDFNKSNLMAAYSVCRTQGITKEVIKKAIKNFKLPEGRLEVVCDESFSIVVDFAHTPNSFEQLLSSIEPNIKGKLIHVFGCAGERDKEKRPEMGRISSKYADVIILTSEDPRSEDPSEIIKEIMQGIDKKKEVYRIPDRLDAIRMAIKIAKRGDLVLVTGKGHEKSMNLGDGEIPWSDRKEILKILNTV